MIGEVRFAEDEQTRDRTFELIVDPRPAHRVVDGGIDAHRNLIGILIGDPLVHLEEIAVAGLDGAEAVALDGVGEVEIDGHAVRTDAKAGVATFLGGTRCHVAGNHVAERGITAFEVVIAIVNRNIGRSANVPLLLRHPDAAVVPEALAHQRELRLMIAGDRNAGRVNLGVAGVREERPATISAPDGRDVARFRVGRQVENVAIAAGAEQHGVGGVRLVFAVEQVAGHDAPGPAVDRDEIEHLPPRIELHAAKLHLPHQHTVGAKQQLLARLAAAVERPRHLRSAKRAVRERAAIFAGERNALGDALVDDVRADRGQAVDVRFAGTEVAALHRLVKQAVSAVAVVVVVLGRVDAALSGDAVRPARRILNAEGFDVVALLRQRRGGRGARQTRPNDDDVVLPAIAGRDELHLVLAVLPHLRNGSIRNAGVQPGGLNDLGVAGGGGHEKRPTESER